MSPEAIFLLTLYWSGVMGGFICGLIAMPLNKYLTNKLFKVFGVENKD